MKKPNRILIGLACAGMLLTSGCIKLWTKSLDIKTYMVEAERDEPEAANPLAEKLWIDTVSVLPPFNVRNLILRRSDVQFETSYYTELLISPSENFRNCFFTWFADSGIFHEVSIDERRGMTHRLAVSILKFYGDTSTAPEQAVLAIRTTLLGERADGVRVLLSKDYEQRIDVAEPIAEDLMRAYNQALVLILKECETDVIAALK
jgi:hypothetical protein